MGTKASILDDLHDPKNVIVDLPAIELPEGLRRAFPDGIPLYEWRYGAPDGPRIWFFKWEALLLKPELLDPHYKGSIERLLRLAYVIATETWRETGERSKEQLSSYHTMFLLFEYRTHLQEYMERTLARRDLMGMQHLSDDDDMPHPIVPGVGTGGELRAFLKSGRKAAGETPKPNFTTILAHALYEQAKVWEGDNPPMERAFDVVFGSLFGQHVHKNQPPEPPIRFDELEWALNHPFVPRLLAWFKKNNKRPIAKYWKALRGQVADNFKRLSKTDPASKQPRKAGDLKPKECRRVFACLVAYSFYYMAECWQTFCGVVLQGLAKRGAVSSEEHKLFEQMHLPRQCLANLPIILLVERVPVLRPLLLDLWRTAALGDAARVAGRLQPLLILYGELISNRRTVEREAKQKSPQSPPIGPDKAQRKAPPPLVSLDEEIGPSGRDGRPTLRRDTVGGAPSDEEPLVRSDLIAKLTKGETCPKCGGTSWSFVDFKSDDESLQPDTTAIRYKCGRCDWISLKEVDFDTMKGLLLPDDTE